MKAIFVLSCFTAILQAQNTKVPGFVTLQNSGGKSAFPVTISVSEGAKISKTNPATGYFEVSCPASGEFFLSLEKESHEVVNTRTTHVYFFEGKPSVDTVRISVNVEGAWLALADQYFRAGLSITTLAHDAAYAETKQKQTSSPQPDTAYLKVLVELQNRANRAWGYVADVAERTAQTDADRCGSAYRTALRALGEKDITKALKSLANASTANEWALRARLHALFMQETAAYADYEAAILASPTDIQLTREYSRYLMSDQKTVDKAKDIWKNAGLLARHEHERASVLHGMGAAEATKNNTQEGVRYLEQAATIRESLASRNAFFAADYGFVCRVLANSYSYLRNLEMAKSWAQKGAVAWTKVPNPCSFSFCVEPASLEFWLAGIPGSTSEEITQKMNNIVNQLDQLAEHYPVRGYLSKAYYLSQRAQHFQMNRDFAKAMADWRELASICEEYETDWPIYIESQRLDYRKFAPIAAQPTNPLGDQRLLSEGIANLRICAKQTPYFRIPLAQCLNNQANGINSSGKPDEALLILEEALQITQPLITIYPYEAVPIRAYTLGSIGFVCFNKNDFAKGKSLTEEAITLYQNCTVCEPISKAQFVSWNSSALGQRFIVAQDNEQAEKRLKVAASAFAELVKLQPIKQNIAQAFFNLSGLSSSQMNLALKLNDQGYMEEVKKNLQEQEALLAILPDDPDLAQLAKQLQEMKAIIKE